MKQVLALALAVAAISTLTVTVSMASSRCPGEFKEYKGSKKQGIHVFGYQSWSLPREQTVDELAICVCVTNFSETNGLHVRWDAAGLNSLFLPGEVYEDYDTFPGMDERRDDTKLYYGAGQTEVSTTLVVPQPRQTAGMSLAEAEVMLAALSNASDLSRFDALETSGRIGVPDFSLVGDDWTPAEIIGFFEENPLHIQKMEMTFESDVLLDDQGMVSGITNRCQYRFDGPTPELYLSFSDPELQQAMFKEKGPVLISEDDPRWSLGSLALSGWEIGLSAPPEKVRQRQADLRVTDRDGQFVYGSIRFDYHSLK